MDNDKAIRAAKLTLGALMEKRRAKSAVERAQGQIAPSKYLPNVPRQVHADGGKVSFLAGNHPEVPPVVYHSTRSDFKEVRPLTHFGTMKAAHERYNDKWHPAHLEMNRDAQGVSVMPVHISLKNPLDLGVEAHPSVQYENWLDDADMLWQVHRVLKANGHQAAADKIEAAANDAMDNDGLTNETRKSAADAIRSAGYDGLMYTNRVEDRGSRSFVTLGPEQVKSAISARQFDQRNPDMTFADGGPAGMGDNGGPPLSEPPVDLGQVREQKQLQTFHKGVMGDIGTRMTQAMEAHQKAVDAGHFDGYEVGDVLQSKSVSGKDLPPMKITGRYVQKWKPSAMTLQHFDRMGAKPTIIEHEGQQYIPMLRYTSGSEAGGDSQEGSLYLDGVKAQFANNRMRKMGGLRSVKARGGSIHLIHGGSDFDEIDPRYSGTGEPGNIRPLGKGLYTFVLDPEDPESAKDAIGWAKRYATKYGRGKKTLHVFQVPKSASTTFNGPRVIEGMGDEPQDKLDAYRAHRNAEPAKDDPAWWDWSRKGNALYDEIHNAADLRMEHLPIGLTEAAINNPKIAQRVGKFDPEADPDEIIKAIRGYADGGSVSAKERFLAGNHPDVPEVLYHGTAPRIVENQKYHGDGNWTSEVDQEATDRNIAAHDFREFMPSKYGNYGPGIYLTDSPETASQYAMGIRADQSEPKPNGQVLKLHVSMKQPFTDATLRHPAWRDYIKKALTHYSLNDEDLKARKAIFDALDNGTATVRDLFLRDTPRGTMVNQFGQHDIHDTIRNSGFDGIIAHRPDGSKEYVAFKPEQVKSAISATKFDPTSPDMTFADGGRVDEDVDGITAYHGSPHDFDEFDIGKIGTGEGAQSYGHGLYFAGNEGIAKHYRDALSDRNAPLGSFKKRDGSELDILHTPNGIYSLLGGDEPRNTDYDRLIAAANEKLQWAQSRKGPLREVHSKNAQEVLDFLRANEGLRFERNPARGHMYKVKLNVKPHELLDWDKPLSEQHPNVQAAIKAMGVDTGAREWKTGADLGNGNRLVVTPHPDLPEEQFAKYEMQTPEGSRFKLTRSDVERLLGKDGDLTGAQIHQRLVDMGNRDGAVGEHLRAGNPMKTGPKWASEVLMRHGIKGIRYRDAGSRNMADGDPTHNYVMFHHDPVKVVDKYALGGYVPQKTQKAYKLFRTKGDGKLYPLFVHADKPVEMGKWLEAEEGPQGKAQGKVKSKLGDLAYRPGWHAGDLPIATHIGGKSDPSLKKPDYRPDNHVWAEVEMAADKDWQAEANSRGKGVKAHITDQVPLKGFYRYKTNPNMTGNWLIGGHMKVNRVLSDDEVKQINDAAGTADLPRLQRADGGIVERSPMFEGMSEHLMDDEGKPLELWHGTPASEPFEAFDDSKIGKRDPGFYGRGHYLTPDRGVAEGYADPEEMGRGSVMGPLHAALKNPYIWDVSDDNKAHSTLRDLQSMGVMTGHDTLMPWSNLQRHHIDRFMQNMQQRGHDGVIYKTGQGVKEIVVFNPNMIKHRDAEVGDPEDPRIMRNLGGRLYSKASKIISRLKDEPMQVEDIIKYALENGAKRSEIDYSDPPRGGMARPSQVAQHIADMQPQVGVQRRETFYRYTDPDKYERQINYLEGQGRYDEAEELNREYEAFSGFGSQGQPQYAKYQLPGGQNYREHILTLDNHQGQTYTAPIHWSGTQNPLAHIRMSDRIIGNRKILHIEELQSDWNNDARKRGFSTGTEQQDYDNFVSQMRQKAIDKVNARTGQDYYDPMTGETAPTMSPMVAQAQIEKYQRMDPYMLAMKMGMQEEHRQLAQAAKGGNGVPRAPYINPDRDDVTELAMKHILTEAAKGGYDGIAFTPDAAQSERWKGTNFKNMYDRKFPGMAQRLIRQHDESVDADGDPVNIQGWAAPHVELTDKARDSILQNGFASFRRGGYVTHVRRAR